MVDSGRKNVIVVLDTKGDEDSDDNFEIGFSNENGTFSDLALITQKLIAKSETARNSVRDRDLVLKRQSYVKEGLWVVMGEDSPVKSGSIIKCSFKTPAQMSLLSATKESTVLAPSTMTVVATPGTSHDGFLEVVTSASTPVAGHGLTKSMAMAMDDSDTISYGQNVAKMLDIYKNGTAPYSTAVDNLVKLTFSIRRIRVMQWIPESGRIEKFIDSHCPFLKHQTFLFFEFELIMKKPCEIFREMWTQSAKFIIEAAKTTNKKQVASLLSSKPFQNMSPEMCSRAALELLPFLVPGKGRGDKAARHLVDSRMESANLASCIEQETRGSPFILYIGSTIHLILEGKPFVRFNTTADAVIGLMASYYVFHFKYSNKVQNALLFLQSYVLGVKDEATDTCPSVHSFSALVDKMKTSSLCL